jgi:type I restriction enzyme, R subunit
LRSFERMYDFDVYDLLAHHSYHARALRRRERNQAYVTTNQGWFDAVDSKAAVVLKGIGHQFEIGGTEALETPSLWDVPEIKKVGGWEALSKVGDPVVVMHETKGRLFAG